MFLCFDLGTTAVKATIVTFDGATSKGTLQARVSVDTHAYTHLDEPPTHRAQDVRRILNAVNGAAEKVLAAIGAMRTEIADIAICDQMHGVVSWHMCVGARTHTEGAGGASPAAGSAAVGESDAVSVTYSDLVTWEDARCDASLLCRLNAIAGRYGLAHTHNGYGCATLAWALTQGRHGLEAGTGRDLVVSGDAAVGTIGAFLACACTGKAGSHLDPTDAASWGMFALGHTGAGRDPDATTPDTRSSDSDGVGNCGWHMAALREVHPALPALMPKIVGSGSCISMLNPAACGAVGLPALAELARTNRVRVHGSIGDHPAALIGTAHLTGANIVPFLGAALDVFINIGTSAQAAVVISHEELSEIRAVPVGCEVRPFPRLRESNSQTLRLLVGASMNGGNMLAAVATAVVSWYRSVAACVGVLQASSASSELMAATYAMLERDSSTMAPSVASSSDLRVEGCFFPERVPVTLDAPALLHSGITVTHVTADALRQPHTVYAAAAAAIARNVVSMLPSEVWQRCGRVVFSGGALGKSDTLRRAVRAQLFRACGREVAVVESSDTAAAFAGALGAAIVARDAG